MDGFCKRHQLVEHFRAVRQLLIVVALLVEQTDGLAVAAACIAEFLHRPVNVAQTEQQHTFLNARACGLLVAFLVGGNGLHGVFLEHVDVAHRIVHLIQIVLVLVGESHSLQSADHLLRTSSGHHFRHRDACIELQFVGRVLRNHFFIGFIGHLLVVEGGLQLSHEVPLAGALLFAHLVLDDLAQVGNCLFVALRVDVEVGKGVVPLLAGAPVDAVAAHLRDDVFSVVEPFLFDIAFCQPSASLAVDGGLGGVESAHVGEGGGCFVERPLVELRPSHEHPRFPEERVVLFAVEPFDVFLCAFLLLEFWSALDAVELDGLLALLDGALVVALAQFAGSFVAYGIEGNHLREVVLDAVFLFDGSIDIGLRAVIVGVVFGHEGMPPARLRGVLLRGASRQDCKSYEKHSNKGAATEPQLTENLGDVMFWVHDSIVKTAWETKIQGACFFNYRAASETRPSPDRALECLGV